MPARLTAAVWLGIMGVLVALATGRAQERPFVGQWRSVGEPSDAAGVPEETATARRGPAPLESITPEAGAAADAADSFTTTLPRQHGQVWREYDLSPYTLRVTSTEHPEQAVIDWILRETGYEAWHGEPLAILSATPRKLRVYHTPAMQTTVAGIVARFVDSQAQSRSFGLRLVSVSHPNWREKAQGLLAPVAVQTPGAQAWIIQKEDAAVLLAELRRRSDFREHGMPYLLVQNGQPAVVASTQPKTYVRDVLRRPDAWPGYQPETGQIDEGFSLELCPLLAPDGRTIDATVRCTVARVEKMVPVIVDVPTAESPKQRAKMEVPEIARFQFHERFRWPADQVLLVSMGLVSMPGVGSGGPSLAGIPLPLGDSSGRAELLVLIESKSDPAGVPATVQQSPPPRDYSILR